MSELKHAIDMLTDGDNLREMTRHNAADFVKAIAVTVDATRQVINGRPRKARQLMDSDGNEYWAVTTLVDGPGEYTLIDPQGDTA